MPKLTNDEQTNQVRYMDRNLAEADCMVLYRLAMRSDPERKPTCRSVYTYTGPKVGA
jgi:hypothetical protein